MVTEARLESVFLCVLCVWIEAYCAVILSTNDVSLSNNREDALMRLRITAIKFLLGAIQWSISCCLFAKCNAFYALLCFCAIRPTR